jgi:hypothetical protein
MRSLKTVQAVTEKIVEGELVLPEGMENENPVVRES